MQRWLALVDSPIIGRGACWSKPPVLIIGTYSAAGVSVWFRHPTSRWSGGWEGVRAHAYPIWTRFVSVERVSGLWAITTWATANGFRTWIERCALACSPWRSRTSPLSHLSPVSISCEECHLCSQGRGIARGAHHSGLELPVRNATPSSHKVAACWVVCTDVFSEQKCMKELQQR